MSDEPPAFDDPPEMHTESHYWNRQCLRDLGVSKREAELFADSVDWHDLEIFLRDNKGCPPDLAVEIVR